MSIQKSLVDREIENGTACPSCGGKGRMVKPITIKSLVVESARRRVGRTEGFRFCSQPSCDVAYFHPEIGARFLRNEVTVRIGQKETTSPRPVCYCFVHTVEDIEGDVARTGTSPIPDAITERCRQGLDRCEETNPQGTCCLGNVRRALKEAQAQVEHGAPAGVVPGQPDQIEEECCSHGCEIETAKRPSR